jgi:hypothetical protein
MIFKSANIQKREYYEREYREKNRYLKPYLGFDSDLGFLRVIKDM